MTVFYHTVMSIGYNIFVMKKVGYIIESYQLIT